MPPGVKNYISITTVAASVATKPQRLPRRAELDLHRETDRSPRLFHHVPPELNAVLLPALTPPAATQSQLRASPASTDSTHQPSTKSWAFMDITGWLMSALDVSESTGVRRHSSRFCSSRRPRRTSRSIRNASRISDRLHRWALVSLIQGYIVPTSAAPTPPVIGDGITGRTRLDSLSVISRPVGSIGLPRQAIVMVGLRLRRLSSSGLCGFSIR